VLNINEILNFIKCNIGAVCFYVKAIYSANGKVFYAVARKKILKSSFSVTSNRCENTVFLTKYNKKYFPIILP